VAVHLDAARRKARETYDRVDRRGLTRAVRAKKAEEVPCANAQRYTVDRGEVTVPLDDVRNFQGGRLAV
jgi:hypothetical protein